MQYYFTYVLYISKIAGACISVCVAGFLFFPYGAFAATFSFVPAVGEYSVGSTFSVDVTAGSSETALNAVSGTVTYPRELIEVVSITKTASIASLWVQDPTYSNQQGTLQFEGVVLNPGFTGVSGKVLTVTFRVKSIGNANLTFSSGSILANDGLGTEILTQKGTAKFVLSKLFEPDISDVPETQTSDPVSHAQINEGTAPNVSSIIFPYEAWSSKTEGVFMFDLFEGVLAMRLLFDDSLDSTPTVVYSPPIASRVITDIPSGVSYLHVQYKDEHGWGPITHYKIQVDTVAPEKIIHTQIVKDGMPEDRALFSFSAFDSDSGIEKFEVILDGQTPELFTGGSSIVYITPSLPEGQHTLQVYAYDKAGNTTSEIIHFTSKAPAESSVVLDSVKQEVTPTKFVVAGTMLITILSIVIPFIALLILLCGLLLYGWRLYTAYRTHVSAEVEEAQLVIKKAFSLLRDDLTKDIVTLEKASKKRTLTREEAKILKRLKQNIDEAEKVVSQEVQDIL